MEMTEQDRTKTSFLTLSGSKISIVVTVIDQKPKEIMMWMTKPHFSLFNRSNFHFYGIQTIIPVLHSSGFS